MDERDLLNIGTGNNRKVVNITPILVAILFVIAILFFGVAGVATSFLVGTYKTLPDTEELSSVKPSSVSRIYDKDSVLIHEFSIERRFWIPLDSMSDNIKYAVVAIEDQRFYKHWGLDLRRIFGAAISNIVARGYSQGASTLTQQLARNLFFTHEKTMLRKIREMLTAIKLEQHYSKDEILELYLNQIYLGAGVYGVEAASQRYFGKRCKDLTLSEAAIIAGTIQRPEAYRPDLEKNIERITVRRKSVLRGMKRMKKITNEQFKTAQEEMITAISQQDAAPTAPYFIETVRQYLENKYGENQLYNGGLIVYTTLDSKAQQEAEYSLNSHLDTLQKIPNRIFLYDNQPWKQTPGVSRADWMDNFDSLYREHKSLFFDESGNSLVDDSLRHRKLQASVVALDTRTGAVRVMIGGRSFESSKFNRAIQAVRQPGSTMKPFVYAAALQNGYTLSTKVVDAPFTMDTPSGPWTPSNFESEFFGAVTIRDALKKSINIPAVKVILDIGAEKVITLVRRMGFTHDMPAVPSLALGACEVTNMELTSAFGAFANRGMQAKPFYIESVIDRQGRVLEKNEPSAIRVLDEEIADLTAQMMRSVVDHGTGHAVRAQGFRRPAGGKTGTTNKNSDAWFVGFTPQIACGVWLGVDERRSMGKAVTGSMGAIPIWTNTMLALHKGLPEEQFQISENIVPVRLDKATKLPVDSTATNSFYEYFLKTNLPSAHDPMDSTATDSTAISPAEESTVEESH